MDFLIFFLAAFFPSLYLISSLSKWVTSRARQCYILDYECFVPGEDRVASSELCGEVIKRNQHLQLPDYKFLLRAIISAGLGERTYAPRTIIEGRESSPTLADSISEMDEFLHVSVDRLLRRSKVSPSEIDVLVVNVAMLAAVPSLASRIISRYKMREDVKVYNLTAMGCSASLISIDLVRNVFRVAENSMALVVTSESLSGNWYTGKRRSMMLTNCLFRSGGTAILLTNKGSMAPMAKLKLQCLVRTHHGARDESYRCCIQTDDEDSRVAIYLGKDLPRCATRCLVDNLRTIAPKILPLTEILRFLLILAFRKLLSWPKRNRPTVNFKTGAAHICIHTGGKAVIDAIGESMGLSEYDLEPARMTLHRFGNTSACSVWYTLGYMEAKKRVRRGERILMLNFGSGFKCNSCLWEAVRDLGDPNAWDDCINDYPVSNLINPFMNKYGWLNDEDEASFVMPEGSVGEIIASKVGNHEEPKESTKR